MEIKISGGDLIELLCDRLRTKEELLYDSNIVAELSKLSNQDLRQAIERWIEKRKTNNGN